MTEGVITVKDDLETKLGSEQHPKKEGGAARYRQARERYSSLEREGGQFPRT